jgi:hypothetical protein
MKIKMNRERPGKKITRGPMSIQVYDDNEQSIGEIHFHHYYDTPEIHIVYFKGELDIKTSGLGLENK